MLNGHFSFKKFKGGTPRTPCESMWPPHGSTPVAAADSPRYWYLHVSKSSLRT